MNEQRVGSRVVNEGHTVVRIAGEGVGQTLFEGLIVPPSYLFGPGIRQERLHKMCRTFQTSAHSFTVAPSLFGHVRAAFRGRAGSTVAHIHP